MHTAQTWAECDDRVPANQNHSPLFALRVVGSPTPRQTPWSQSVRNSADTHPQVYGNPPADLLFDLAGLVGWLKCRFPSSTGYHVEAATGISAQSVQNWLERRSRPSAEHFSILMCVFGPSLVKAAVRLPADWIERACEAERLVEIEAELHRLHVERAALAK